MTSFSVSSARYWYYRVGRFLPLFRFTLLSQAVD